MFVSLFAHCGSPFGNTTCDGTAQAFDIIMNTTLAVDTNVDEMKDAICTHMTDIVERQENWAIQVQHAGQSDDDKLAQFAAIKQLMMQPLERVVEVACKTTELGTIVEYFFLCEQVGGGEKVLCGCDERLTVSACTNITSNA